jgi:hypothetical protein
MLTIVLNCLHEKRKIFSVAADSPALSTRENKGYGFSQNMFNDKLPDQMVNSAIFPPHSAKFQVKFIVRYEKVK